MGTVSARWPELPRRTRGDRSSAGRILPGRCSESDWAGCLLGALVTRADEDTRAARLVAWAREAGFLITERKQRRLGHLFQLPAAGQPGVRGGGRRPRGGSGEPLWKAGGDRPSLAESGRAQGRGHTTGGGLRGWWLGHAWGSPVTSSCSGQVPPTERLHTARLTVPPARTPTGP